MSKTLLLLSCITVFFSCSKEKGEPVDLGMEYAPQDIGLYITYNVTEVNIDKPVARYDTALYQLKEKVHSQFIDNSGRPSLRLERYWRSHDSLPWGIKDVWYSTRTNYGYEKIEENERFIKLEFPLNTNSYWDGNDLNSLPEWIYEVEWVDEPYSYAGHSFVKTAKILQRDNINFVEYEHAWEIYAEGVGLVRRELYDLQINNGDTNDVERGYVLLQNMTSYGIE